MHKQQQERPISEQITFAYERLLLACLEQMQLLHEQVEFLLELVESENLNRSSKEEKIQKLEQELSMTNHDLCTALMLNKLNFHEAKVVAKIILKSENSAGESCAQLLTAIYGSKVQAEKLQQIDKLDVVTNSSNKNSVIFHKFMLISEQLKNHSQQISEEYNKLEDKFLTLKSYYERIQFERTELKTKIN